MFLTYSVTIAIAICLAGTVWQARRWFRISIGPDGHTIGVWVRLQAGLKAAARVLFSKQFPSIVIALIADIVFQRRIARQNIMRWAMHMVLFYGFIILILLHAMDGWTVAHWDDEYASTRNPYLLLRNIIAVMMAIGITIAVVRRMVAPPRKAPHITQWR